VIRAVVSIVSLGLKREGVTAFHSLMTEPDHEEHERRMVCSAPLPTDPPRTSLTRNCALCLSDDSDVASQAKIDAGCLLCNQPVFMYLRF